MKKELTEIQQRVYNLIYNDMHTDITSDGIIRNKNMNPFTTEMIIYKIENDIDVYINYIKSILCVNKNSEKIDIEIREAVKNISEMIKDTKNGIN